LGQVELRQLLSVLPYFRIRIPVSRPPEFSLLAPGCVESVDFSGTHQVLGFVKKNGGSFGIVGRNIEELRI
jgi:hypothetical protein